MPMICESPSAIAPSMSARCEMDLSPGTRIVLLTVNVIDQLSRPPRRSPQPALERRRQVGLLVAVFHDNRCLKRQVFRITPARFDGARSGHDDRAFGNLERRAGGAAINRFL